MAMTMKRRVNQEEIEYEGKWNKRWKKRERMNKIDKEEENEKQERRLKEGTGREEGNEDKE
jgi:hypothetical protein